MGDRVDLVHLDSHWLVYALGLFWHECIGVGGKAFWY